MYKVAIFDMDGTIIDSMEKWSTVFDEYMKDIGVSLEKDYRLSLNSLPMMDIFRKLQKDDILHIDPKHSFDSVMEIMRYGYHNQFTLKPGVKEALELMDNKNIKMAVATATPERIAIEAIKKQGLEKYFQFIQTCDNTGHYKFEDEYWLKAAKNLNSNIENSVVFEDALYCIETVKNLNGNVVAIADNSSKRDIAKIKSLSNYYIDHYNQLNLNIFEK